MRRAQDVAPADPGDRRACAVLCHHRLAQPQILHRHVAAQGADMRAGGEAFHRQQVLEAVAALEQPQAIGGLSRCQLIGIGDAGGQPDI